ncbi:MAG: hypothetical protein COA69_11025 [Robiginitomaculum sp.]|nr:MAG: hypothetical protein COA69_11025 [Robiginitomaculum sp.]
MQAEIKNQEKAQKKETVSEPEKQSKRDQILSVAASLFDMRGYHDTRLEDIAAELGKGKTSISYHFKSKEALLDVACERSCDYMDAELETAAQATNGLERILAFVRNRAEAHAQALSAQRPPLTLLAEPHDITDVTNPKLSNRIKTQILEIRGFLEAGCEDGSINISSPDASAFLILNILREIPQWLANIPNARHGSAIDGLCDILRNGIAIDKNRQIRRSVLRTQLDTYPAIFDRQVKNQLKRDALMRTGTRYLNRKGYRNLSLSDVAAELGVTRGAFYYYIADKDSLVESCFHRSCDQIEKTLHAAMNASDMNALEQLEHALFAVFEGHITNMDPLIRLNLLNVLGPAQRLGIEVKLRRLATEFSEIIAKAMLEGSARTISLDALESILIGTLFSAGQWRLAATPLNKAWHPSTEPTTAATAYYQPLISGLSSQGE